MTTYETVYLMNETGNLVGQAMMDMITIIFAIIAAALFAGDRLTRTIVIGITVLSAIWVIPMLGVAYDQLRLLHVLAETLKPDQLGDLSGIARIIGPGTIMTSSTATVALIGSHAFTYVAAIWFLNDSRKRHEQRAT